MAKIFNTEKVLSTLTQQKCCLLDEYKHLAKQIEQNRERMRKIKPLLEMSDIKYV